MKQSIFNRVVPMCGAWIIMAAGSGSLSAEQGVQFRGVNGNGVTEQSFPHEWGGSQNLAWSTNVPGGGWSSPIAVGDRIFLTTAVSEDGEKPKGFGEGVRSMGEFSRSKSPDKPYRFEIQCLSAQDGSTLWNHTVAKRIPPHKIHPSNSYATESPVTDGDHVFAYFASVGIVACTDLEGNEIWQRDLGSYRTSNDFGTGSSLAIHDGNVFVQCDNEEQSFVCAMEATTGKEVWRDDRDGGTSWSSPVIWNNRDRTELVVCGSGTVTGYEPATGKVLWKLTGTGGAYSASPTFDEDRIYFGQSGQNRRGPLVAVNAGAAGDLTLDSIGEKGLAWIQETSAPGMCSPVAVAGRVYVLSRGILSCHDASTGERLYRQRLQIKSSVTASLWAAGEKVYALSESGETSVFRSGDKFELLASNAIEGLFWSTPSVTDNALLIRGASKLHCIR